MLESHQSSRIVGSRSAFLAIIGGLFLTLAVAGATASHFDFIDSVADLFVVDRSSYDLLPATRNGRESESLSPFARSWNCDSLGG